MTNVSASQHLLWILPWGLLVAWVGSPRFLGTMAASRTRRILDTSFRSPEYRVRHDIDMVTPRGTLHLDHVVIMRSGIRVIDSLSLSGEIKGTEVQQTWKARSAWRRREFDNPVHANRIKTEVLAQVLDLPLSRFEGLVVLHGRFRLPSGAPSNVLSARQLFARLRMRSPEVMTGEQIDRADKKLSDALRQSPSRRRAAMWRGVQFLMFAGLLIACASAFRAEIGNAFERARAEMEQPGAATDSGQHSRNTDSMPSAVPALNCVYSVDTGRCTCRDARGERVETTTAQCQELSERGSVLKQ